MILRSPLKQIRKALIASKAKFLKAQGFNRVSLGVQSMDDRYLKFLGRGHDASMARERIIFYAKRVLININLDLMYAFPGQTQEELEKDVQRYFAFGQ